MPSDNGRRSKQKGKRRTKSPSPTRTAMEAILKRLEALEEGTRADAGHQLVAAGHEQAIVRVPSATPQHPASSVTSEPSLEATNLMLPVEPALGERVPAAVPASKPSTSSSGDARDAAERLLAALTSFPFTMRVLKLKTLLMMRELVPLQQAREGCEDAAPSGEAVLELKRPLAALLSALRVTTCI
ncbi:uncharacterized protein LOC114357743 isoform X3 [Ostrinia furnacalis]|uniref:uncharacterized protein LOC114357743 isoform X3 n=1 Tax=Ostrinia furnacalis TaxID=93504 RepID=UPI00103B45B1|nr:uncharacterized protein LOC114357743 isoform X3 [Ostrinia furnacalis]XP_028167302.1 uncharacterized protein LOC114357743 isoform X3 [Ostrinia furnacalis]